MSLRMTCGALLALLFSFPSAWAADIAGVEMHLPATERSIRVIAFRAPSDTPHPAALMLHGAGGFDRRIADYNHYAATLANAGIDAYLVYYYSDQDNANGGSEFESRYPDWAKLVDDLAGDLLKLPRSNGRVGLIGFSNGGILATGAATLDSRITAAVIYYGTEPWPLRQAAKRYPPLLILHGDADPIIPVEAGRALARNAKALGARVDLVIYPGEVHGFGTNLNAKNGADALTRTVAFLSKELAAPQ